jgi:hypothetical protein
MEDNELILIKTKYTDPKIFEQSLFFAQQIKSKYPFLELKLKWNEPCFCFQDNLIAYFTEKTKLDNKIFKEKTLFLGFYNGFKLFHSDLFVTSSHVQVRYVNLSKLKKSQFDKLINLIGQSLEID